MVFDSVAGVVVGVVVAVVITIIVRICVVINTIVVGFTVFVMRKHNLGVRYGFGSGG